jgi:ubiquinone/menaquinone biosynthesis C-methylase UbiE
MNEDTKLFMPTGATWVERAAMGELRAVISPTASDRGNDFHHAVHVFAATRALRRHEGGKTILDFGCGTGRFLRFFGSKGAKVIGTDITFDMLAEAQRLGLPKRTSVLQTDGFSLPLRDQSIDAIWCCGVLRYSLFVSPEAYEQIAHEMFRVLKPGGEVINVEMYVDLPPGRFTQGFENAGFTTTDVRLLKRYDSLIEDALKSRRWPRALVNVVGRAWGALHYWFANPHGASAELRDYLFYWSKMGSPE